MTRSYWVAEILQALTERSVVWLSGVHRAGKTTLAKGPHPPTTGVGGANFFERQSLHSGVVYWLVSSP